MFSNPFIRLNIRGNKRYINFSSMNISSIFVLLVAYRFKASTQNGMDVVSDVCSKREFLVAVDIGEGPFPIGALNTLGVEEKIDFVDFFATLYNYCTLDHDQLLAFTFKFTNIDGSGYLSLEELTTLVTFLINLDVACNSQTSFFNSSSPSFFSSNFDSGALRIWHECRQI